MGWFFFYQSAFEWKYIYLIGTQWNGWSLSGLLETILVTTRNMIASSVILLLNGNHDCYFYSSNDWIIHVKYWHKQQGFHLRCDNIWLYELRAVDRTGRISSRSWLTGKLWASSQENLILLCGNNNGADQTAHLRSLISTIVFPLL